MTQLHDLTALEQRDALRRREIRALDLLEHYLGRIDRHGSELGAFTTLTADLAEAEAAAADRRLDAGGDDLPALLGLPTAFKDLSPVAGVRTTLGSAALADHVPAQDGHVVGLLRRAGSTTVGTTHAAELGLSCYTETDVVDRPAVTPYDVTRYAAGSSGGAAAAVAAGLLPWAHGSDGAGSVRTPASVTGLVGVKPTRGRLSPSAATFIAWGTEGPIARTVADAALALDVMAEPSAADLYGWRPSGSFLAAAQHDPDRPLRVLVWDDAGLGTPTPDVLAALARTEALLSSLGHEVVHGACPLPWLEPVVDAMEVLVSASVASALRKLPEERRALVRPYTAWCADAALKHDAADHAAAQSLLAQAASRHLAAAADYDVVLTPVTTSPAVPVGWFDEDGSGEECGRRMLGWCAYTPWANLTGQPALSLPAGSTATGLPLGVQLTAARRGDDALLLSLAGQLERAAPFAHQHPAQWEV